MSDVGLDAIRNAVESLYDGGWTAYVRDFRRFTATAAPKTEQYSPIKQRAIVGAMTRRPLRDYDEIVKFDFNQDAHGTFVVSRPSVIDRRSRRDIITEREITLYKFTRNAEGGWEWDFISITESVNEVHTRWGTINTLERDRDKRDQFENCYRPGTDRTPLKGWVARLELSWKQAHENEVFPKHNPTA